jgi:transposase
MHMWTEIRRLVLTGQKSKRAVCQEYHLHWKTLQKILQYDEPPGYRQKEPRRKPKLEPFLPIIEEILKQDQQAPKKQRHTIQRIFERLRDEHGYLGGRTVVGDAVRAWQARTAEVFLPLAQRAGEAQADFGEATVLLEGEETKVALFVLSLPYSDAVFCQVFPRECTETFQEGHARAFEFLGGVPRRISYDNSRIAVAKLAGGRGQEPTREFLRLQSHFLFEHHFCRVRRPNEKGHVENLVGYTRRNFLVPVPQVESLEALNQQLSQRCREELQRQVRGQPATKAGLLEEEQQALLPVPKQSFEARRVEPAQANSLSLVRFDTNDYSVPTAYAHHSVTAVGSVEEVRLVVQDQVVARHRRDWGHEQVHYDPLHYLALLERKPGALDYARPLEDWPLPECLGVLRRRLEGELGHLGRREFIRVLRLLERHAMPELTAAVERALQIGALTVDAIRLLIEHLREEPARWFRLDGHPHLQGHEIPPPRLDVYATLVAGGAS